MRNQGDFLNIIFMGTPDFAVPALKKLIGSEHNVLSVFTQPDKPVGRKHVITPPAVKQYAAAEKIPVYQPDSLKTGEAYDIIKRYSPDLIVVAAYGKILPTEILNEPKYGCVNIHASLLPKYRGAAPIQRAILNGDSETGVCLMKMEEGLDTGDILLEQKTDILPDETSKELFDRLSIIGADLLIKGIDLLENGEIMPVKQDDSKATTAEKITKALSPIDWNDPAAKIHNQVRGLEPWPCAETVICEKKVKIHKTALSDKIGNKAGMIVDNKNALTVCCGDGKCVDIILLQPNGKKTMDIKSFLSGYRINIGDVLSN